MKLIRKVLYKIVAGDRKACTEEVQKNSNHENTRSSKKKKKAREPTLWRTERFKTVT